MLSRSYKGDILHLALGICFILCCSASPKMLPVPFRSSKKALLLEDLTHTCDIFEESGRHRFHLTFLGNCWEEIIYSDCKLSISSRISFWGEISHFGGSILPQNCIWTWTKISYLLHWWRRYIVMFWSSSKSSFSSPYMDSSRRWFYWHQYLFSLCILWLFWFFIISVYGNWRRVMIFL